MTPNRPFPTPRRLRQAQFLISAFAVGLAAMAGESYDLTRTTPVPADQQIPAGDFFRPALAQEPRLNRAGTEIAAVVTAGEDRHLLLVYDVATRKYGMVGGNMDYDINEVRWLSNTRLVYEVSAQKLYGIGLYAAEVGDLENTYPLLQYQGARIISVPRKDPMSPLVWVSWDGLRPGGGEMGAALVNSSQLSKEKGVNLLVANPVALMALIQPIQENNDRHIIDRYPRPSSGRTVGYLSDKDGNLEYAMTTSGAHVTLLRLAGDGWVECPVDLDNGLIYGSGNRPGEILARAPHVEGRPSPLQFQDTATGRFGEVLVDDKGYDFVGYPYRDPVSGEVIGAVAQREGPHVVWFNDAYRRYQDLLNRSFPGLVVRILGSNDAQNFFLVATFSDRQPARYAWVDFSKHAAGLFKDSEPWIDPKRMQPENIIRFKTRDGRMLDAYLTLPKNASRDHPAPLVVLPHGGPFVRENWGFDGEAQFLASRGYAVLKPNYRGSPGYDWMFPDSDRWDFVKMSHDVVDATKAMIASGLVDPSRVAMMGGSFGGYLSLKGIVDEPTLYRCAVVMSGVFDWAQLISDKKYDYTQFGSPEYNFLMRRLGDPRRDVEKFDEIAPVRHVDRVRVPVFVSHGRDDDNVDVGQSTRLVSELEKHNVPHESYIVGSEGHGMHYFKDRVEQYTKIEAFLAKYMAPDSPPVP
ncbi:MAG: alpha/beta fold hydrolase [Opitutaceae bacterium]